MYKCLTVTYHHPSTHCRVYRCPPFPYHMQIPPGNIQMYMGAWGIQWVTDNVWYSVVMYHRINTVIDDGTAYVY